ncbi:MAG: ABC transporter permease subunit, partial [Candidatus Omnitrophica bacterium]|nr:ABC transporter permease subunit [Candidatus Omnitrophota bacterium]
MTNFQFPILQREIQGVLRRKMTFFFAFVFYAILGLAAVYFFAALQHSHTNRGALGRGLFIYVIVLGYPCVGVYAALFSSSLLVAEREKKTLDILLTSPVHGSSVILQKVLAPILTACLLVFGLIPILSLCFMLGGVS